MNRRERRILVAEADRLAIRLASSCVDYTTDGAVVRVEDWRAVKVLQTAFASVLRNGCEPVVIRITQEVANAFPRQRASADVPADATPWLAVGIDGEGRGTYSLRRLRVALVGQHEAKALAEMAMLGELRRETERIGIPMGAAMGEC